MGLCHALLAAKIPPSLASRVEQNVWTVCKTPLVDEEWSLLVSWPRICDNKIGTFGTAHRAWALRGARLNSMATSWCNEQVLDVYQCSRTRCNAEQERDAGLDCMTLRGIFKDNQEYLRIYQDQDQAHFTPRLVPIGFGIQVIQIFIAAPGLKLSVAHSGDLSISVSCPSLSFLVPSIEIRRSKFGMVQVSKCSNYWRDLEGAAQCHSCRSNTPKLKSTLRKMVKQLGPWPQHAQRLPAGRSKHVKPY